MEGYKFTPAPKSEVKKYTAQYGTSVHVSRDIYKLVFVKSINDGYCSGLCDFSTRTIYIAIDQENVHKTLIHEIMHAEIECSGLRQAPSFTRDFEEIVCELASHAVGTNYVFRKR